MERKIVFAVDEFYHLYNRGVEKRVIFLDQGDYSRFQTLLYVANSFEPLDFKTIQGLPLKDIKRGESLVSIGAYCLMPNHFHLLVREKMEHGISRFMSKLMTAYSMYFNKKYTRSGRLFQNTFQAKHAGEDNYLRYLFSYIHLNPVKLVEPDWRTADEAILVGQKVFLQHYAFSSFLDYAGSARDKKLILETDAFPEYFSSPHDFRDFIRTFKDYP